MQSLWLRHRRSRGDRLARRGSAPPALRLDMVLRPDPRLALGQRRRSRPEGLKPDLDRLPDLALSSPLRLPTVALLPRSLRAIRTRCASAPVAQPFGVKRV